ncbi:hypothetical protein SODALDRAFT_285778, partial [Sodiomyces alkalinus F11]
YGYTVYKGTNLIHPGYRPFPGTEVFNAEAEGARTGLLADLKESDTTTRNITVYLDNIAVI